MSVHSGTDKLSQLSQVERVLKANQTKSKLKSMLKSIDEGKSGLIKEDLFFQLIKLHNIELSADAKSAIASKYKKGDKIVYSDALMVIGIDLESMVGNNWGIRK